MEFFLHDNMYIKFDTAKEMKQYRKNFLLPNPEYYGMLASGGVPPLQMEKEINVADTIEDSFVLSVPRNYISFKGTFPESYQHDLVTNEVLFRWTSPYNLRPHQSNASAAYLEHVKDSGSYFAGKMQLACGKGKTMTGLFTAYKLQQKTLVLVDQKVLASQWASATTMHMGEAALIVGDGFKLDIEEVKKYKIVIATVQKLIYDFQHGSLGDFFEHFGLAIIDECHITGSEYFAKICRMIRSKYILGLSATMERPDGWTPMVDAVNGATVYTDLVPDLAPEVEFVEVPLMYKFIEEFKIWLMENDSIMEKDKEGILKRRRNKFEKHLLYHQGRNDIIVKRVQQDLELGHTILIICKEREQCKMFQKLLEPFVESTVVTGEITSRKKRELLINEVRDGKIKVLVATSLAKKGLDVPVLSCLYLTYLTCSKEFITQTSGRILRALPGKPDPVIRDFVDPSVEESLRTAIIRYRIYQNFTDKFINTAVLAKRPKDIRQTYIKVTRNRE